MGSTRASCQDAGEQGNASASRTGGKPPPPGFGVEPPRKPRPESTGLLPSLPVQCGMHTYFESTESELSGGLASSAREAAAALSGTSGTGIGVQGQGSGGAGQEDAGEAMSTLRTHGDDEAGGRAGAARIGDGIGDAAEAFVGGEPMGMVGGAEARAPADGQGAAEGAGAKSRRKKKKQQQWHELQGDEASEARCVLGVGLGLVFVPRGRLAGKRGGRVIEKKLRCRGSRRNELEKIREGSPIRPHQPLCGVGAQGHYHLLRIAGTFIPTANTWIFSASSKAKMRLLCQKFEGIRSKQIRV